MARIQSSVSPQTPNPLTVAMVHTGYLKFATERNIVPKGNAVPKTGPRKSPAPVG
jgi:hypothetical protein